MPRVSVIVPNYNHARFLRKRIDSVLQQTFQDFELILLDDCSSDDSRSILSSYAADPHVRAVEFNDANSGSTFKQWNKGIRLARGEYVWIAESDDYADERLLERLVAVLDAAPEVVFVNCRSWQVSADDQLDIFADYYLRDLDPQRWTADFIADGREECRNFFVRNNPVCNASSVVFRKAAYDQVGGADEGLRLCGDWKLWAAMALTGRVAYLSLPLNYHRVHKASVTEKSKERGLAAAEHLHVIRWVIDRVEPTEATRDKLCEKLSWFWVSILKTKGVPLRRRWAILRDVIAIDPRALRGAVRTASGVFQRKFFRRGSI